MSWQQALNGLEGAVRVATGRLRETLTAYEEESTRRTDELALLRTIDVELVKYAFDLDHVMEGIVTGIQRLTSADLCYLLVLNGDGTSLKIRWSTDPDIVGRRVPVDASITGEVYRSGESLRASAVAEHPTYHLVNAATRSELAVAMKDDIGGVLAVVNLESFQLEHFTAHHVDLAELVAGQAAIAFRNARLHDEFQAILETAFLVQVEEDVVGRMLASVGRSALDLIGAEQCQVLTVFEDQLVVEFTTGPEAAGATRVPINSSVSGRALLTGDAQIINDVKSDMDTRRLYKSIIPGMRSELAVPITYKGAPLGVINVESPRRHAFSAHDAQLLRLFAAQVAVALNTAKRLQSLVWKDQTEAELWALAQIGDVYGSLIHRLNSDAGLIKAEVAEIRFTFSALLESNPSLQEMLNNIATKAEKILDVPSRLRLQLERVLRYEEIDLVGVVEQVLERVGEQPGIKWVKDLESVDRIDCSPQVEEAVENLVMNAIEVLEAGGGEVEIATRPWVTKTASGAKVPNGVEFSISDSCGGISEQRAKGIWDIGRTHKAANKRRHLGFGLWWVRAFVERVGGNVELQRDIAFGNGRGCRFVMRLPTKGRRPERIAADSEWEGSPEE